MKPQTPLPFLARPGYRRRRLIEAIRLMPYIGALVFFFPLLWAAEATSRTSLGWLYLFIVWFGLIIMAAMASRAFRQVSEGEDEDEDQ